MGDYVCILYGCSVPVILRKFGFKIPAVFNDGMVSDLKYIVGCVQQSYHQHLSWREVFRAKRTEDRVTYEAWEAVKRVAFAKDKPWGLYWQLARASYIRVHEFRAWVLRKYLLRKEFFQDPARKEQIDAIMREYVNKLLSSIHEIVGTLSDEQKMINLQVYKQATVDEDRLVAKSLGQRVVASTLSNFEVHDGNLGEDFSDDKS